MSKRAQPKSSTTKVRSAKANFAKPLAQVQPAEVTAPQPPSVPGYNTKPTRHTYALKQYTAERRGDGWYVCRTPFVLAGEKAEWSGPFETIETAVLAIARRLATEIADRHTRDIERHKLAPGDPLYGLKPTTGLVPKCDSTVT